MTLEHNRLLDALLQLVQENTQSPGQAIDDLIEVAAIVFVAQGTDVPDDKFTAYVHAFMHTCINRARNSIMDGGIVTETLQ